MLNSIQVTACQHLSRPPYVIGDVTSVSRLDVQSPFSQCIMSVPNFFYALWHFMQDKMCHKVWLSMISAKNVTCTKSLEKTGKYCVFLVYLHGINIHGREITTEKRIERSLSDWVHLNNVGLCPSWGISRHLSIPQICNFGQGSAHNSPKMEACCKFGKSWHGNVLKILATIHKKHIRVDFDPKNFRYTEENK